MIAAASQRIDLWIWHARMVRTRSAAARLVTAGKVRVNGTRVRKPGHTVAPGDVLTFVLSGRLRVLRVVGFSPRRGSYREACTLYDDESPPVDTTDTRPNIDF